MNAQSLHTAAASARHMIHGRHVALSLLVAAVLVTLTTIAVYRFTAVPAAPASRSDRAPATVDTSPLQGTTGSAYDGQGYGLERPLQSVPLGIALPRGMERSNLPPGLTDYLLPERTVPATQAPAPPPGSTALPAGWKPCRQV